MFYNVNTDKKLTYVYATVRVLNDVICHAYRKPSISVCVATVNRYGDKNAHPC